jgi:putative methionine-R-sulfoxide reductase with GAF domain
MLVLGPWRGEQATEHVRIPLGKGVCGAAARTGKTEVVDDVSHDARYLSCFLSTRSEIVVPIKKRNNVIGEIDIDSDTPAAFDANDAVFLEKIATFLSGYIE